jgi:hypothetical protein
VVLMLEEEKSSNPHSPTTRQPMHKAPRKETQIVASYLHVKERRESINAVCTRRLLCGNPSIKPISALYQTFVCEVRATFPCASQHLRKASIYTNQSLENLTVDVEISCGQEWTRWWGRIPRTYTDANPSCRRNTSAAFRSPLS